MPDTLTLSPWSSTPPTRPGVYRFRNTDIGERILWVELRRHWMTGELLAYSFGLPGVCMAADLGGEWQHIDISEE